MSISIESSCLLSRFPTGISRYGTNLIHNLNELQLFPDPVIPISRFLKKRLAGVSGAYYGAQLPLNRSNLVHGLDIVLPRWQRAKKVLTIHDIYLFLDPRDEISPKEYREKKRKQLEESIRLADRFISVSQITKNDFCEFFNVSEERVDVVHLAANDILDKPKDDSILEKFPEKFIFFIGNLSERKNCLRILEAYARSSARDEYHFVMVGSTAPNYPILEKIKELGIEDKVILPGFLSDPEIKSLYENARALIFPTLYEGFGIPILESMLMGTPVLTSNIGSAPEVGGEHALYVNPLSVDEIKQGIEEIVSLKNETFSGKLKEYALNFSWKKTAEETLSVYQKLL